MIDLLKKSATNCVVVMCLTLTLSGCLSNDSEQLVTHVERSEVNKPIPMLEVLYGVRVDSDSMTISVESFGCTKEADFKIDYTDLHALNELTVVRVKKDKCRMKPKVIQVTLPLSEEVLSDNRLLSSMVIKNPIGNNWMKKR